MEKYQGVKFQFHQSKAVFNYDQRLGKLNQWAMLFSQLGLAPLHADGAYGNHSYRTGTTSFVITKSAMTPSHNLTPDNFCQIVDYNEKHDMFITEGCSVPSSESFLHRALYHALPEINSILHGHCPLLNDRASELGIPVTEKFYDYGTIELADSALELIDSTITFFLLKDHGFVALGKDIDTAGNLTLDYFSELIKLLRET